MKEPFRIVASKISYAAGTAGVFASALFIVIIWGVSGPIFGYSEKWQLVINTLTTIVTFLMVFLIQNTQNRESRATQLKLDELLRTNGPGTRQSFIDLEDISDDELEQLTNEFKKLHNQSVQPDPVMHKLHKKVVQASLDRKTQQS